MNTPPYPPLSREEVIKAVERKRPSRIPLVRAKWWGEGLDEQYGSRLDYFDKYPEDVVQLWIEPIQYHKMDLSWDFSLEGAHDSRVILDDWAKLDEFIDKMPDPATDPQIDQLVSFADEARAQDQYIQFGWWRLFFERPWEIRGMENLLTDFYIYPEQVHRLYDALCNLYCGYLERAIPILQPDGFWASDDLGHQTNLFMRPKTFRQFLKPYYQRVGEVLKPHDIHWWLHSCGNNTPILGDLAETGVNVFHPVQKGTMDETAVVQDYGDQLTFLAGFDVQHILQEATPDRVRAEVRHLIDTFDQTDGGMCMAAGNGIVSGTPFENIDAFLDESLRYGTIHREQFEKNT